MERFVGMPFTDSEEQIWHRMLQGLLQKHEVQYTRLMGKLEMKEKVLEESEFLWLFYKDFVVYS